MLQKVNINVVIKILVTIILLPFCICAYFNFAQHDDLYNHAWVAERGITDTWLLYIKNHDGRWLSNALTLLVLKFNFLLQHYYIYFILMQAIMIFFIFNILKNIYAFYSINPKALLLKAVLFHCFLLLQIPETSTAYFWATNLFSYQFGTMFCLYLISLLFLLQKQPLLKYQKAILFFGVICLIGLHELLWVLCLSIVGLIIIYNIYFKKALKNYIYIGMAILIFGLLTLFLLNVTGQAKAEYIGKSISYKIVHTATQTAELLVLLLQKPLFWFGLLGILIAGNKYSINQKTILIKKQIAALFLAGIFVVVSVILVPHIFGMGVPNRVFNMLSYFLIFYWGGLCFYIGLNIPIINWPLKSNVVIVLATVFVFTNTNFIEAIKSIPTAYLYKKFNNTRINEIEIAKQNNQKAIKLLPLDTMMAQYLNSQPNSTKKIFESKIGTKPITSFFSDDLTVNERIGTYAEYYGIDTVKVNGLSKPRFGITDER